MAGGERALRRQVARLGELTGADRYAILALLPDEARADILTLLVEGGVTAATSPAPVPAPNKAPPGVSGWLQQRLGLPPVEGAEPEAFELTEHVRDALRACAAELAPLPPRRGKRNSLLDLALGRLRPEVGVA